LEYPLAIIATRDQVVKPTSYFNSRLPCHGAPRLFTGSPNVNISILTPLFNRRAGKRRL